MVMTKAEMKARQVAYYQANKEAIKERQRVYDRANSAKRRACPVKRAKRLARYQANKEMLCAKRRAYQRANLDKIAAKNALFKARKLNRTPKWLTEDDKKWIAWHYKHARKMTELTGIPHHVDHIVPMQGKNVSGLHCPLNLQVIPASENLSKSNKYGGNE